ncbi:MAG: ATP-binding protein [Arcicella sp.]|nr:ATP-binding protein [Arcicella sp.]
MNNIFINSSPTFKLEPPQVMRIFDLMPDLVYVLNLDEQSLFYTNGRLYDVLGYTWDDIVEMNYSLGPVMVHDDLSTFGSELANTFDNLLEDSITEFSINFRHKNGSIRELRNRATVMTRHPDGRNQFIVVVAEDITESKALNLELERRLTALKKSNAELEQFAYVASHDLQEPLRKINTFGERLTHKYSDKLGDEGNFFAERMNNAATRMQALIQDLLTYSRVSSLQDSFEPVDLKEIFKQVLNDLELKIQEKKATITFQNLPTINAQPIQMYQLFQNLLTNALKFIKPDVAPIITVKCRLATPAEIGEISTLITFRRYYRISVSDNGIGLENEYAERIFTLFQRLHGRSEYEGTGLGLAICRKIVEGHQGQIKAKGVLGVETEFVMYLPETPNLIN